MDYKIVTVPGDGIGPDIIREAIKVMEVVGKKFGHNFTFQEKLAGGIAIDTYGETLPKDTVECAKAADAVLLGAVGGYKWDNLPGDKRPEKALLGLRQQLGLFCNLRPAVLHKELKSASPLKEEIIGDSLDVLIVRELTSGIYFGKKGRVQEDDSAFDTMYYSRKEIERVVKIGFESAMKRNKKLTVVDKANVLETSRMWREVANKMKDNYPTTNKAMTVHYKQGPPDWVVVL